MKIQTYHSDRFQSRFAVLGDEHRHNGTLVLLHGLYENLHLWDEFAAPLAARFRVVVIDALGHNPNAPLAVGEGFTMQDMADEVIAVMRLCGIENAVIAGHSMGGAVAMYCLKYHADKVRGVCLFHATPFADPPEVRESRFITMEAIAKGGKETAIDGLMKRVLPEAAFVEKPEMVAALRRLLGQVPESGMIAAHAAMRDREDTSALLEDCAVPILFILGKQDAIIPVEKMLPLVTKPRKALLCLLDGIGHTGMLESPKECRAAIEMLMMIAAGE